MFNVFIDGDKRRPPRALSLRALNVVINTGSPELVLLG